MHICTYLPTFRSTKIVTFIVPSLLSEIKYETRRRLVDEGIFRIERCLEKLNEDQVWYRPNGQSNSIGNLILHLDGNVRQWLISSFRHLEDKRDRPTEFDLNSRNTKAELAQIISALRESILETIAVLEEQQLSQTYSVQGFQEKGLSIIIHVIEHFSYHVGQISYVTKMLLDIDLGYYAGIELDVNA